MKFKKIDGTLVEKYLWQGLTRLLAIYDANDNILMRFEYADSRLPVAMQSGGATYYLAYDQVGSLRIVTDASGTVIKALDYDSFGNMIQDTNPSFDMPFGFAGGLYDPDTGLVRFGFREYSPEIGRWTAKDPILFLGGMDLYGYCLNDPINFIDSKGLSEMIPGALHGILSTGGPGEIAGTITGAVIGGSLAGPLGAILGGIEGGIIGSMFDPAGAGELNYEEHEQAIREARENERREHEKKLKEYEDLLKEIQKSRKDLEPMLKKFYINMTPCP